MVSFAGNKMQK